MNFSRAIALLAALVLCTETRAQFASGAIHFDMTGVHLNQMLTQSTRVLAESNEKIGAAAARPVPSGTRADTRFQARASAAAPSTVDDFAQAYPETQRPQARAVFAQLLNGYAQIEKQFRIPKHDVAGAVAAFLAGSYMAYRDRETGFPDANFLPLVDQLRSIIAAQPEFQAASEADKQAMYEQLAILGMFMATTRLAVEQKPNAAVARRLKETGGTFLERFLGVDADRVEITPAGLAVR